jgi:hypothetical protein
MIAGSKWLTMAAIICAIGTCFADEVKDSVAVTIHARTLSVKTGEPIMLDLTISNSLPTSVSFVESSHSEGGMHFGVDYAVKLTTPEGKVEDIRGYHSGSHTGVTLNSGDQIKEEIALSDKLDMTNPGEYSVQVGPYTPNSTGISVQSWSNIVVITVSK